MTKPLSINSAIAASSNSLSYKYSTNSFPFHVDTSHWVIPCKYIVLGCSYGGKSNRETQLFDFQNFKANDAESDFLFNTPFKVKNGRNSFYSTILSKKRKFIRYDPGCMDSAIKNEIKLQELLLDERRRKNINIIRWKEGKILVIDNWRMLHSRGTLKNTGSERVLKRVLVV